MNPSTLPSPAQSAQPTRFAPYASSIGGHSLRSGPNREVTRSPASSGAVARRHADSRRRETAHRSCDGQHDNRRRLRAHLAAHQSVGRAPRRTAPQRGRRLVAGRSGHALTQNCLTVPIASRIAASVGFRTARSFCPSGKASRAQQPGHKCAGPFAVDVGQQPFSTRRLLRTSRAAQSRRQRELGIKALNRASFRGDAVHRTTADYS